MKTETIRESSNVNSYTRLLKVILASLLVHNKLRPAEVANLYIYQNCFYTAFDKMIAIKVQGKPTRGIRPIHVLIEETIHEAIEKLLLSRPASIPASDYPFARYANCSTQEQY